MNITVTISAPELANAIQTLAQALSNGSATKVSPFRIPSDSTESPTDKKVKPTSERKAAKEEAKEGGAEEQIVSLETVRAKLAALSKSGKQTEVKALIASFDASKLTDIPAERYGELLTQAEAIG
ncbi:hypothetical protein [Brevibacillus laterosporus]|uniref:rRNA biogenesis protein rrp5 n=1 Tax=Brevibacillus laterosporus TaxID=1465 RepID=A0AAP3GA20_BRELA|nr:hypothetical protein [Brevibacillus laterosporus]MCR8979502.1 hypothetical protein [Brevibacillus laterosporus]MCZ0806657.1 hypothetical protein [Brevibacillus laterosporus]MCZ0825105.1 hypothetical protein [Brevibacillus laterosporus]MCZ0852057.1 hypothetical protein [Brevibacillus laterosporus]